MYGLEATTYMNCNYATFRKYPIGIPNLELQLFGKKIPCFNLGIDI